MQAYSEALVLISEPDGVGIPLALVVDGANRHDVNLLRATRDGLVISRPEPTEEQPQHLCLDAAYDSTAV
jgi:putative transposase